MTRAAAARALGWILPCAAVALGSAAETRGRVLEAEAGSDPAALSEAERWLPFDGRVRLVRALGEGFERAPESLVAWRSIEEALERRPRHPETLLAAAQSAAARGEDATASRLYVAAVRAAWHDATVAIEAARARLDQAADAASRAPAARERAAAADRAAAAARAEGRAEDAVERAAGAAEARAEAERLDASARAAVADVERLAALVAPDAHGVGSLEDVVRAARALRADLEAPR